MPYYRVPAGLVSAVQESQNAQSAETDIWPSGQSRPFVLVSRRAWQPPTDIYETSNQVVIKMEVAGMNEDSLQIAIQEDLLTIRGRRGDETGHPKLGYHHMGITYGEFLSEIRLPGPIAHDGVRADYQAGFLMVSLPKQPPRTTGSVRIHISE
jgi:HSP20 family protein